MTWCTVHWSRSLLKMAMLGQFLVQEDAIEEITIRPEIWWHDGVYHEGEHCMKWPHSANVCLFWSRQAEGAVILWTSCQGQTLYWPYLRNGWSNWYETNRKCISWILGQLCDLDLWHHPWPWPWIFQGQILKYMIMSMSGIVCQINVKPNRKDIKWILGQI